ncbi:MAG TPA: hypothetical protein VEZ19_02755 [Rubrobacter sp.]|nr:hypothetical protein [Rubrobacter sp.]
MRKVLLLMGLSMLGALLFASVAFAQSSSPSASASGCTTSPAGGGESVTVCVDPGGSPIASTTGGPLTPLPSDDGPPIVSTTGGPLTPLPSDGGSPSPSASATATPTASVLPETGGPASAAFGIVSLALLVGTGIMALGLVRRS